MIEGTFLQKDDLILRAVSKGDGESFLKWHNDPLLRNVIGSSVPFYSQTFQEICNGAKADSPQNIWFSISIGNNLIGIAGLHRIRYIQGNAEVSLLVGDPNWRGKGFGSTALELLVDYAFSSLRLHRVYAQVLSENNASIRLVEKCSFIFEGRLHDAVFLNGEYSDYLLYARLSHLKCMENL